MYLITKYKQKKKNLFLNTFLTNKMKLEVILKFEIIEKSILTIFVQGMMEKSNISIEKFSIICKSTNNIYGLKCV